MLCGALYYLFVDESLCHEPPPVSDVVAPPTQVAVITPALVQAAAPEPPVLVSQLISTQAMHTRLTLGDLSSVTTVVDGILSHPGTL